MMPSNQAMGQVLQDKDIRPSMQRVLILEHLLMNRMHPTAEEIYMGLHERDRSISKATVYNTLALFEDRGLVRVLTMGDDERRYDIGTNDHGHFICDNCGQIQDFCIDMDSCITDLPQGNKIRQRDVYYRGLCQTCRLQEA